MTVANQPTKDDRAAVLMMLRRGQCTQAEAATLCAVTRQTVAQWCRLAKINATASRLNYLATEHTKARRLTGRMGGDDLRMIIKQR